MASGANRSSPYQPTTEERLRASNEGLTCNPWGGRREHGRALDFDSTPQEPSERNPWVFTRCLSRSGQAEISPSPSQNTIGTNPQSEPAEGFKASLLTRTQTLKKKIVKGTEQFFGLGESEEDAHLIQRKWTQRRHRHYSKRYGRPVAEAPQDGVDSAPPQRPPLSSVCSIKSIQEDPGLVRTFSRRQSVASMAWKGLRSKMGAGAGMSYGSQRVPPQRAEGPVATPGLVERGRSFAPAMLAEMEEEEKAAASMQPEEEIDGKDLDDEVFFDFVNERAKRPPPLPPKKHRVPSPTPMPQIEEKDVEGGQGVEEPEAPDKREEEKVPLKEGRDEGDGPPAVPPRPSARGQRIGAQLPQARTNRREMGKGLVGRWLNRTIRRKRLPSRVKEQMEALSDNRPFFTYWISFVQVVILIVSLSVYGLAPIGFSKTQREKEVEVSRSGTLVLEKEPRYIPDNFWIGPLQEDLILMGAKFAPCMRPVDKILNQALERETRAEADTGCCMKSDDSGCIQTSRQQCSSTFSTFQTFSKDNKSRIVCGQDPQSCTDPASVKPYKWDEFDITSWPTCKKVNKARQDEFQHLHCEITGRPCCLGTQARCKIISQDQCEFLGGKYHQNATLCSQVDCLADTCGMLEFLVPGVPDQVYRLWMPIFNHAGIIHIICTLVFQFTILRDIERMAGWLRIAIIYLFSGIGGYLISAILIPYQVEVGPSGSVFGIIACLFVELIQSWQLIRRPWRALLKLCGVVLLLLLLGLLPYVDNFAHMGGFLFGFLLSFVFLPYITFGTWDRRRKIVQILVSIAILILLYVTLFLIFWSDSGVACPGCEYLNCLPFTSEFCEPYNLGQQLQPRD